MNELWVDLLSGPYGFLGPLVRDVADRMGEPQPTLSRVSPLLPKFAKSATPETDGRVSASAVEVYGMLGAQVRLMVPSAEDMVRLKALYVTAAQ